MRPLTEKVPRHAHPSTFICMKEKHMSHRLTIKGQVTIPKEIRDFLGLEEGCSCVEFVVEADGSVSVRKAGEKPRSSRSSRTSSVQTVRKPVHGVRTRAHGGVLALLAGGL
jgi:AbrB family looped-hinge helix DNA binding protein